MSKGQSGDVIVFLIVHAMCVHVCAERFLVII